MNAKKPQTTKTAYGLKYEPAKYNDLALARQRVAMSVKPACIMLGDDEKFWVVCPADAQRLECSGIEYAE